MLGGGRVKKSLEMHEETQTPEKCHLLHSSKKFRFNKCLFKTSATVFFVRMSLARDLASFNVAFISSYTLVFFRFI